MVAESSDVAVESFLDEGTRLMRRFSIGEGVEFISNTGRRTEGQIIRVLVEKKPPNVLLIEGTRIGGGCSALRARFLRDSQRKSLNRVVGSDPRTTGGSEPAGEARRRPSRPLGQ